AAGEWDGGNWGCGEVCNDGGEADRLGGSDGGRDTGRGGVESGMESGDGWLCGATAGRGGSRGWQVGRNGQFGRVGGRACRLVLGPPNEALACEGQFCRSCPD